MIAHQRPKQPLGLDPLTTREHLLGASEIGGSDRPGCDRKGQCCDDPNCGFHERWVRPEFGAIAAHPAPIVYRAAPRDRAMIVGMSRGAIMMLAWFVATTSIASEFSTPANTEAEFRSHCRRLRESENPFFGRQQIAQLSHLLQGESKSSKTSFRIQTRLALEYARVGELDRALELIEDVRTRATLVTAGAELYGQILSSHAVLQMQLGERENCLQNHQASSCILPMTPEAIHQSPEHNQAALQTWLDYAQIRPADPQARWLMNLAALTTDGHTHRVPERRGPSAPYKRTNSGDEHSDSRPRTSADVRER